MFRSVVCAALGVGSWTPARSVGGAPWVGATIVTSTVVVKSKSTTGGTSTGGVREQMGLSDRVSGSARNRGSGRAAVSSPAVAASSPPAPWPCAVGPGGSGQVRHPRVQPLDLPLQGFDLFSQRSDLPGVPPLFRFVLLGQSFQCGRQAESSEFTSDWGD